MISALGFSEIIVGFSLFLSGSQGPHPFVVPLFHFFLLEVSLGSRLWMDLVYSPTLRVLAF